MRGGEYHLAYVFERFPTFTQTFCVREVLELERQGLRPMIFSIRDTREESVRHFPEELVGRVHYLPQERDLVSAVEAMKAAGELPQSVVLTLRHWGEGRKDKRRVYEAAYVGRKMAEAGIWHAHTHFAGIGARTCWWLARFYRRSFSFTGHANDIFRDDSGSEVTLGKLMGDAALVATVSEYTAEGLRQRFPLAAGKVKRVYNGLDLDRFRPARERREGADAGAAGERRLLSVGRLIEKKGFDELIAACALAREKGAGDFVCDIVGEGPLEDALQAQIELTGCGDIVRLAGPKSQEEIIEMLGRTDLFVLPCVTEQSGGKDNLPTVIMEAMAAGVPCISTRVAGIPEMVIDGETGLLVDERDTEGLAGAMAALLANGDRARAFGEAGVRLAESRFAQEKTAGGLRRLLTAYGLVRFDAALTGRDPAMWGDYARQVFTRIPRLWRWRNKKVAYLPGGRALTEKQLRGSAD